MPPRRSSRAPSAAPEPVSLALPAKRKRGNAAQAEESSSKTKSTSRSQSTGKSRSKARGSLPEVAESEEEEEEREQEEVEEEEEDEGVAPPRRKKARPSIDKAKMEDEAEAAPRRARKSRVSNGTADDAPTAPKRRAGSRQPSVASRRPSAASGSRAGRKQRVASIADSVAEEPEHEEEGAEDVEMEEEEVEEPKSKRGGRRTTSTKSKGKGKSKVVKEEPASEPEVEPEVQSEEEYNESDVPSARKSKKGPAKGKAKAKKAPKKVVTVQSSDEDEPPTQSRAKATPAKVKTEEPEEEEQEDEASLFDPPPMPDASQLANNAAAAAAAEQAARGPVPRLVISKLALINFKSYAGRQEIGPFHKSFSAIVGPNGSGKSNTIDALLFVFGYRASKMRQGRVSELIHNSARYPDLDHCSVEVHFRDIIDLPGADAYKVVPGSKLVVSRTAYKNNASKYHVNGVPSSLTEVQKLLKGRGIDLDHNRFLILQGEVESIAQMKPKAPTEHEDGLLEYLEDIIETSELKKPIEEALVEVEQLQEERSVKMARLRLVEKEKEALEEKRREAINWYKMKNDHIHAQSRYYQWMINEYDYTSSKREEELNALNAKLEKEAHKNKADIDYHATLTEHLKKNEETFALVQAELEKAKRDYKEMEKKGVGIRETQKHTKAKKKKLDKSVAEDTSALRAAQHLIKDSEERLEKFSRELEEHQENLVSAEAELERIQDGLRGKTEKYHKQIQAKQKELQPWTSKIDAKQTQLDVAQSERDTLALRAETAQKAVEDARAAFEALQTEQAAKVQAQGECRTQKEQLKREMAEAQERQRKAQAEVEKYRGAAATSRNKFEEARANQSASRSRNNLLDSLKNLSKQGRIKGFHGRLGDLGTIPDKYDVAISTAAGGSLGNLIVEKVEQGKECIEYLRTNNLGRGSFMVLEKLPRNQRMDMTPEQLNTPENVPRLFDLVKPKDPMYRAAFYKAMSDTLVAKDTDQATRVAYGGQKRWRVVTLDGKLIEASGAMSGGGGQPQRGAMNSKLATEIPPETVRQYERDSEAAGQALERAQRELHEATAQLEGLQKRGPELEMEYSKLMMEVETRKTRIAEAAKRLEDLKKQNKPNANDQARIRQLDTQIASCTAAIEQLQTSADEVTEAIKALEGEILKIGGVKLMVQKEKVEGLRRMILLANEAIVKAEAENNKATHDVKRLATAVENNNALLAEVSEELAAINQEDREAQEYIDELRGKVDEATADLEKQQDRSDDIKAKMADAEEALAAWNTKKLGLEHQINQLKDHLAELDEAMQEFLGKFEQLKLHDLEEEEEDDSDDEDENQSTAEPKAAEEAGEEDAGDEEVDVKPNVNAPSKRGPEKLKDYSAEELRKYTREELLANIELLDEQIKNAKVDLTVLKEYKKQQALLSNRVKEFEDATKARDDKKAEYDGLRKQRLEKFMTGFTQISMKLKEMYQMITLGGNAELELVDSMDPFSEGIIFSVMPPKKSWKNISNLSGGEKTLSSLALVFALHVYKPTPLYFMDEIDAALDFRNVSIVGNYIKDRTKNAQFIIISLRNDMFELSHRLIGIYKTSNATRSISIDNHALLTPVPVPDANARSQPANTTTTSAAAAA